MYKSRSKLHKLYSLALEPRSRVRRIHRSFSDVEDEVMTILEEETAELGRDTQEFIIGAIELEKAWLESLDSSDLSYIINLEKYLSSNKRYYSLSSYTKSVWKFIKNLIVKTSKTIKNIVKILVLEPLKALFYKQSEYVFSSDEEIVEDVKSLINKIKNKILIAQKEYYNKYQDIVQVSENTPAPDEFEYQTNLIINLLEESEKRIKPSLQTYNRLLVVRSVLLVVIMCALAYKFLTLGLPSFQLNSVQQIFEYLGMIFHKIKSFGLLRLFASLAFIYILSRFAILPLSREISRTLDKKIFKGDNLDILDEVRRSLVELVKALNEGDYVKASKLAPLVMEKAQLLQH